jgi:hypothetical protein
MVGSNRGAVPASRLVRFPDPPAEPDVRLTTHPALHQLMPVDITIESRAVQGDGMVAPR